MNPYINLKSYTEANARYFKGRDNEIADILAILKRSDVVILYSESAEGKSSLLNAGLSPRLRQMSYIPINIVFTDDEFRNPNPDFDKIILSRIEDVLSRYNGNIVKGINGLEPGELISKPDFSRKFNESEMYEWISVSDVSIPSENIAAKKLTSIAWWVLRNFAVERYAARFHFVLIFDQFEEVFSHADLDWINSLFKWLEELYSDKCPEVVLDSLFQVYPDEETMPSFNVKRSFKEIFSMRNEYIGELDYWGVQKHFMPELKNFRYCLKPLSLNEAKEVVNLGFETNPELKNLILAAVSGVDKGSIDLVDGNVPRVQAMLLSVVCSTLSQDENNQDYIHALKVGDLEAIQMIVYDVYRKQLNDCRISNSDRGKIEQTLIDLNGRRVRIKTSTPELKEIKFDLRYKDTLKKKGIIKSTRINGDEYVELVHDQLATAIYRHERKNIQKRRSLVSIVLAIVLCVGVFAGWLRSGMDVDFSQLAAARCAQGYALSRLNDREPVLSDSGYCLSDNPVIESFTIDSLCSSAKVCNNINLKVLYIKPRNNDDSENKSIYIDGNVRLRKIEVSDSISNLKLYIKDSNGFCQIVLGKGINNLNIEPREKYLEFIFPDSTYQLYDERVWNVQDSSVIYIPDQLLNDRCFDFPLSIESVTYTYNGKTYYNNKLMRGGKLDLSSNLQIAKISRYEYKNGLFNDVILPPNLKEIEEYAFENCKNLKHITIPASVIKIDKRAFDDECDLIFEKDLSENVLKEIKVEGDTIINSINILQRRGLLDLSKCYGITTISYSAFENSRLDSIILPPNPKEIKWDAFKNCKNLKHITIPASVIKIDKSAFDDDCDLIFEKDLSENIMNEIKVIGDTIINSINIPQRRGLLDLSKCNGITTIRYSAFENSRLDSIILPPNLKKIGFDAFKNCKNLKHITIPASVIEIGKYAFDDECDLIFEKDLSENIMNEIEVKGDTILKSINIPQRRGLLDLSKCYGITTIGYSAFENSRLDSIILPPNLKEIERWAFEECKNLKNLDIPSSVSHIEAYAFDNECNVAVKDGRRSFVLEMESGLKIDSYFPRKNNVLDFREDPRVELNIIGLDTTGIDSIFLSEKIEAFYCDSASKIVYIGDTPLSDLVDRRKYGKFGSWYSKLPLSSKYKGTYFDFVKCQIHNGYNRPKDIYYLGKILYISRDSTLEFDDWDQLAEVQSIHLGLPRPLILTRTDDSGNTVKFSEFSIDIPDSIKKNITLYVPYESKKFYEENLNFKAFKEIREDSMLRRYEDMMFFRLYPAIRWMSVPVNAIITIAAILLVIVTFSISYKKRLLHENPYMSSNKVNILSAINGVMMGIIAILGFMALYWWIWDISNQNYFWSVICGGLGAVIALSCCYYNIFAYMCVYLGRSLKRMYNFILKNFR